MGKTILIATLLLTTVVSAAISQDTIYIGPKNSWLDSKENARKYAVRTPISRQETKVAFYTMKDSLLEVGHYTVFVENAKNSIRNGPSIFYFPNGKESRVSNYLNDKRHGAYQKFYEDGKLKYSCQFVNGKREGDLTMYYNDGTIWRTEKYENGKFQEGEVYNEKGKKVKFYPSESMPEYPGGITALMADLKRLVKYPKEAVANEIEGRILIQVTVDKQGYISQPQVVESADALLEKEAMRVVTNELSKVQWKPGIQDGESVRVRYVLPITFKLPTKN